MSVPQISSMSVHNFAVTDKDVCSAATGHNAIPYFQNKKNLAFIVNVSQSECRFPRLVAVIVNFVIIFHRLGLAFIFS